MYTYVIELTLFLFLAFMDIEFTKRMLSEAGIDAELNPYIRKLCKWIGIEYGVDLGIGIPTGGLAVAGWYLPHLLPFALGVRFCLFLFQQRQRYGE